MMTMMVIAAAVLDPKTETVAGHVHHDAHRTVPIEDNAAVMEMFRPIVDETAVDVRMGDLTTMV